MPEWKINSASAEKSHVRRGEAATTAVAWQQAAKAVLEELAVGELEEDTFNLTVDGAEALLMAGRTETGERDLETTRNALEQLVTAVAREAGGVCCRAVTTDDYQPAYGFVVFGYGRAVVQRLRRLR